MALQTRGRRASGPVSAVSMGKGAGARLSRKFYSFHIYLVFQYTVLNVLSAYPTVGRLMGFSTSPVLLTDIVLITRKSI